ncbi:MAG: hypothetical protein PHR03_04135 [Desulfovibrionales bacterium]|nr:hypothetical protein [Desulfovibrionales bacterium]
MRNIIKRLEDIEAAIAFAEAGERNTALEFLRESAEPDVKFPTLRNGHLTTSRRGFVGRLMFDLGL